MPKSSPKNLETKQMDLRFILTSTIGHEVIFSKEEIERIASICQDLNKTIWKKLQPFIDQCNDEHSHNRN